MALFNLGSFLLIKFLIFSGFFFLIFFSSLGGFSLIEYT